MQKLRFGILGGTRGLDFMTRVLLRHPYAQVTAICEKYEPLKQKILEEAKLLSVEVEVFSDYDAFLESGLDAVVVANFANAHVPFAIKALEKGIHVLSENITSQTMKESVELCEAVEKSGKIYAYGENCCYLPHVLKMRELMESGEFGELMYAEGNFFNDCSFRWHLLTRGDRNHWRNHVPSTFYCTHSLGPVMYISGRRPVKVVAMETQRMPYMAEVGARNGSGAMEIMELDNGAMAKGCNGNYRRDYNLEYRFIAEHGTIESDPYHFGRIRMAKHNPKDGSYTIHTLDKPYTFDAFSFPKPENIGNMGDFELADTYLINTFICAIMGDEKAKRYVIDVYRALDMSLPGLLGFRSILKGNNAVEIPDLRDVKEREFWRNDNISTDPAVSQGEELLPSNRDGFIEVGDEVYKRVSDRFLHTPITSGSH